MSKNKRATPEDAVLNNPLVSQYVRHGKKALLDKDWDGAMAQFDKAITYAGKRSIYLLDWKVKAMTEMPDLYRSTYELTQLMIQDSPDNYRGYYRQARLLHKMKRIDAALLVANKAVKAGPTKAQDEPTYRSLQRYRSDLIFQKHEIDTRRAASSLEEKKKIEAAKLAAKKSRMNFIHLLSPDILINIAEAGLAENSGFSIKMAGVCRSWREILLNTGTLWNTLVLGKRRVLDRTKYCLERTRGKIKEIIVKEDFEISRLTDVSQLLKPHLGNIVRLTINGDAAKFSREWRGEFKKLEYLKIKSTSFESCDLVYRLLSFDASSLKELEIEGGRYEHIYNFTNDIALEANAEQPLRSRETEDDPPLWTEHSVQHLSSVRTLVLKDCFISAAWPDQTELLCHFPKLQAFEMINVIWESNFMLGHSRAREWNQRRTNHGLDMTLEDLQSYSFTGSIRNLGLYDIKVPNLKHLDLWSTNTVGSSSIIPHLNTPGLVNTLSSLISLDIGRCTLDLADILSILPKLTSLKFLNVSYCSLGNSFLEKLERKGNQDDLLPNLIALSIAGNSEITSGPLRRFVMSRTPDGLKPLRTPTVIKKGGAFRPSTPTMAKSSPFGPSQPKLRPSQNEAESSAKSMLSTSTPPIPSESITTQPKETLPSIQWLCIDNCERIEPEMKPYLKKHANCLVHNIHSAKMVENRVRGKAQYHWSLKFEDSCDQGDTKCFVRKVAGTKDSYYIHHTCKKVVPVDPSQIGWTQLSQVQQSTQYTASQINHGSLGRMISSGSFEGF